MQRQTHVTGQLYNFGMSKLNSANFERNYAVDICISISILVFFERFAAIHQKIVKLEFYRGPAGLIGASRFFALFIQNAAQRYSLWGRSKNCKNRPVRF